MKTRSLPCLNPDKCNEILAGASSRTIANNTTLSIAGDGGFTIRLHGHAIIHILADGSFVISSCGFRTATTKQRLNALTPARVYQRDGDWLIAHPGGPQFFADGTVIRQDGSPSPVLAVS